MLLCCENACAEGALECPSVDGLDAAFGPLGAGAAGLRTGFGRWCTKAASSRRTPRRFAHFRGSP